MTEQEAPAITAGGERVQIEIPLVAQVREREDRGAVRRPSDDVMDALGMVGHER